MKKSFIEIFKKTDAELLGDCVDRIAADEVSADTVSRIADKVTKQGAQQKKQNPLAKWVPAAAIAACAALAVGVAVFYGIGRKNVSPPTVLQNDPASYSETKLTATYDTKDSFSENPALGEGSFSGMEDRAQYDNVRFFESDGVTYAIFHEGGFVYRFENGEFISTGVRTAEKLFLTTGTCEGYAYVGGVFHCAGDPENGFFAGTEKGVFRVDMKTQQVEKYIDSDETVLSILVDNGRIYYSTCVYIGETDSYRISCSLKCVDIEKKEISVLISDAEYGINDLKMVDGNLYFLRVLNEDGVCFITPDMTLGCVRTGACRSYTVENGVIYTYGLDVDRESDPVMRICTVSAYDLNGNAIGVLQTRQHLQTSSQIDIRKLKLGDKYYVGEFNDSVTVYDGRIVSYGADGVWLEDIRTGEAEKILDDPFKFDDPYRYERVSKTVYGGKLYICGGDTVIEYDNGTVKTHSLKNF